jgi:MFS family permease
MHRGAPLMVTCRTGTRCRRGPTRPRAPPRGRRTKNVLPRVLAISQLMVVLDATIVNVALNRIRRRSRSPARPTCSGSSPATRSPRRLPAARRQARARLGRRRVLHLGAVLFRRRNASSRNRRDQSLLIAAAPCRASAARDEPRGAVLLTVVTPRGKERDRALGIWASITAGGAALGLELGGVLTEYLSWRWVFFVTSRSPPSRSWGPASAGEPRRAGPRLRRPRAPCSPPAA